MIYETMEVELCQEETGLEPMMVPMPLVSFSADTAPHP